MPARCAVAILDAAMKTIKPIFSSNRYLPLIFALVILLGGGAAFVVWGLDLAQHYGLSPGDGGVLRPLAERIVMAGFVGGFGFILLVGGIIYMHRYVLSLKRIGKTAFALTTLAIWGTRTFIVSQAQLQLGKTIRGKGRYVNAGSGGSIAVNAPYRLLRIKGHPVPYVLDMQGKVHDRRLLLTLLD